MAKVFVVRITRKFSDVAYYQSELQYFPEGLAAAFLTKGMADIYAGPCRSLRVNNLDLAYSATVEEYDIADEPRPDLEVKLAKVLSFLEVAVIQSRSFKAIVDQSEKDMIKILGEIRGETPRERT